MDIIAEIRRRHFVSGETISSIARSLKLPRPRVRKHLQTEAERVYERQVQLEPTLSEFKARLIECCKPMSSAYSSEICRPVHGNAAT